jgi:hypothetical protein
MRTRSGAPRAYVPVRLSDDGNAALRRIATDHFEGNRSAALRALLRLGLAAWDRGAR